MCGSTQNPNARDRSDQDRKSTRLNSSHSQISYAVFCLNKKNTSRHRLTRGFVFESSSGTERLATSPHGDVGHFERDWLAWKTAREPGLNDLCHALVTTS